MLLWSHSAPPRVQSPRRTREVQQQQQQQQQHAESREGGQEQAQSPVKHRPRGSSIPVYRPQGGVLSPRQPVVHHHGGADAMAPKRDDEPPVSQKQNQPVKAVASPLQSPRETLRSPRAQARITTDKPATSPRVSTVAWARESTIPSVGGRGRGATKKPRKPRMSSISHAAAAASSSGVHQSKLPPPPGAHSPRGREGGEVHRPSERGRSMKSPRFTSAAGGKRGFVEFVLRVLSSSVWRLLTLTVLPCLCSHGSDLGYPFLVLGFRIFSVWLLCYCLKVRESVHPHLNGWM